MIWESEQSLVDHFIKLISKDKSIKIMREVETNFGRPDILLVEYNQKILEQRLSEHKETFEFTKIMGYLLAYLSDKRWVKTQTIKKSFFTSEVKVEKTIHNLSELGLVDYKEDSGLVKLKKRSEILVVTNIQAYEAKLSKWKYAIEQAERHLWFTGYSAVLLPNVSPSILNKTINECNSKGLSLTLMLDQNTVTTILKPQNKSVINTPLLWQINEQVVQEAYNDRKTHPTL
ncbi:hypothetical protein [Brevibacillus brevis]|nr:hypothetical protein [Brevibacillus brevis]PSJ70525.1 hypothetical protein C7J99_03150 [Brevibacillus brevis]RED30859.1 hypothetical protein DES34_104150 [Brevibacillus brevis]GEC88883.1 hypothetical protein BBR01nite_12140 [Brevibacillus brevis]VEF89927.1 Uncharacterised protein [Brevibacillus brevis]